MARADEWDRIQELAAEELGSDYDAVQYYSGQWREIHQARENHEFDLCRRLCTEALSDPRLPRWSRVEYHTPNAVFTEEDAAANIELDKAQEVLDEIETLLPRARAAVGQDLRTVETEEALGSLRRAEREEAIERLR